MRTFGTIVTIVAFFILIPQTIRHVYVRWIEPRGSVLDKYKEPMKENIEAATSLGELLELYENERGKKGSLSQRPSAPSVNTEPAASSSPAAPETYPPPSSAEANLEQAISEWERCSNEIYELRFYWFFGLVLVVLGIVAHKFSLATGLVLRIIGFSEMIYWTTPSFVGYGTHEMDRLLVNKLMLSSITLALLTSILAVGWKSWYRTESNGCCVKTRNVPHPELHSKSLSETATE